MEKITTLEELEKYKSEKSGKKHHLQIQLDEESFVNIKRMSLDDGRTVAKIISDLIKQEAHKRRY